MFQVILGVNMRDPKRIDKILNIIKKVWDKAPDLRLMQLLGNAHGLRDDPYFFEDDKLEAALNATYPDLINDTNKSKRTRKRVSKTGLKGCKMPRCGYCN